jgi:hypothetical protein
MNTSRKARVWFFVGPTLWPPEIHAACAAVAAEIRVLPPIQQGDLIRRISALPDVVGIIDGFFHQSPAVLHKEILLALEHGTRVLGAASLGALRAAELDAFGMEGIGEIYRWYKAGYIDGDDEVAVVHASQEESFRPLTVPLVNVRHNLQLAHGRGLITPRTASLVLSSAKRTHFTERTYETVLRAAQESGAPDDEWAAFRQFLQSEAVDLKHDDAMALVRVVAERMGGTQPWPPRVSFRLQKTKYFRILERDYAGYVCQGRHVPEKVVLSLQKLLSRSFPDLLRQVAFRCLAADEAVQRGLAVLADETLSSRFRRSQNLTTEAAYQAWLQDKFLSETELVAWLRECDLHERLLGLYRTDLPGSRTDAELHDHLLWEVADRTGLREEELTDPLFRPPGILWEEPLVRELKVRGEFRPALELACRILDFEARQFNGNSELKIAYDALLSHASEHLESWITARWKISRRRLESALRKRGFVRYQEFLETARLAYSYEKHTSGFVFAQT